MNSLNSQPIPRIKVLSTDRQLSSNTISHAHLKVHKQAPINFNFPKSRFIEKAWKVGHYERNSSISNANFHKSIKDLAISNDLALSSYRYSSSTPQAQDIFPSVKSKCYHPNQQTPAGWKPKQSSSSMMNYQTLDYDPITHVQRDPRPAISSHRQKGLCEFYDQAKLNNKQLNPSYQAALTQNKSTFHRGTGEFSQYASLCVKLSGEGPFRVAPTLLKNK